ncbi:MAG: 23S rRNA (guanosine(2251)-2'-O)-methyltransferase RlmB [Deltaproteobacteria bacterium]|nr:23S rRNA (guanosine(2251)-2'-O)-methyltransferase RlmB [Deltaproteobacteria bacterium]
MKNHGRIAELWIARGKDSARARELIGIAHRKGISVCFKEKSYLDEIMPNMAHQGMAALTDSFHYTNLEDLIRASLDDKNNSLLLAADHITDEGNLGAVIRTAAFFGAHGLLIPKDRSALVTESVIKRSSGSHVHLPISIVVNMVASLERLSKAGLWIIGASGESSETIYRFDWTRDTVLVIGSENRGLSRSVRKLCHQLVSIPGTGRIESLNVSVACGIILAEISRQRKSL